MASDERLLRLIGQVYDAAVVPGRWQSALDTLAEMVDGHSCAIWCSEESGRLELLAATRFDPEFLTAYNEYYHQHDPWIIAGVAKGLFTPGVVQLGEEVVASQDLRRSLFYNEIGKRHGMIGGAAVVFGESASIGTISLTQRRPEQFDTNTSALFQVLAPHFDRAFRLQKLLRVQAVGSPTAAMLDLLPSGVMIVDAASKPVFVNRAASRVFGNGLRSGDDGLSTDVVSETRALRALVSSCDARHRSLKRPAGGALSISRPAPRRSLRVLVAPLPAALAADWGTNAAAMIYIHDAPIASNDEQFAQRYGLTPAELRIANMLARGHTVTETSERLGLSANTVRTHLKHIFHKTQTRKQAQLVRLMLLG